MSLYRRKDSPNWWVKISVPGHCPVQRSAGTPNKLEAQEFHDRLASELWRQSRLGERPTYYWDEAVIRFLEETGHKRDHEGDKKRLQWLQPYLEGRPLEMIDRDLIDEIMKQKEKKGRAPATINRYLATIRTILRRAEREWRWLDRAPAIRMRKEPDRRVRWITREEAAGLLDALPAHLADAAEFSLATGLRQANVLGLQWSQIDLRRRSAWIYADQSKGKRDVAVPLNDAALEVLARCSGKHPRYVFSYRGEGIKGLDSETWKRACKKAGIANFRWHDLRHTWASWHVQAGTSLQTLMELGGWRSYRMVLRYAHLASDHLHAAAANVAPAKAPGGADGARRVTNQLRCEVIPLPVRRRDVVTR